MSGPTVGIIGAGPGGLALGILLARAGFRDFTMFDREDDVGGTWWINTYPGLACDVKSHLYSYSFDLNPDWSRLWSAQPEILAHFQRCADKYGLRPHLRLRTEIRAARWQEGAQRWCLTTAEGERHHFDVLVSAVGLFTRPLLPDLAQEEPFTGTVMRSARWDHSIPLAGKRIAVLGTGSTASQLLPELAKVAGKVYSVQRSPTWILPKPDRRYTRRERWAFAHVFFMLYGPNTNVGSNSVIFMLEAQARYIVRALKHMRRRDKTYIAVRPGALADFVAKIDRWMAGTVWTTQCSNYFRAANGRVVTQWPGSARSFWGMTRRFKPGDFRFEPTAGSAPGALTLSDRGAR